MCGLLCFPVLESCGALQAIPGTHTSFAEQPWPPELSPKDFRYSSAISCTMRSGHALPPTLPSSLHIVMVNQLVLCHRRFSLFLVPSWRYWDVTSEFPVVHQESACISAARPHELTVTGRANRKMRCASSSLFSFMYLLSTPLR